MKREALWLLHTHCGRWLINKHLTNPLRNLVRLWTNSQDAPYSISDTVSFTLHLLVEKVHLTWSTAPAGTSWLILPSSPHRVHTHFQHRPAPTHKCPCAPAWIHFNPGGDWGWGGGGWGGDGWLKSYWEIKVGSIKLWICCKSWWNGRGGGSSWRLIDLSLQTFTIYSLPIDGDRCQ